MSELSVETPKTPEKTADTPTKASRIYLERTMDWVSGVSAAAVIGPLPFLSVKGVESMTEDFASGNVKMGIAKGLGLAVDGIVGGLSYARFVNGIFKEGKRSRNIALEHIEIKEKKTKKDGL